MYTRIKASGGFYCPCDTFARMGENAHGQKSHYTPCQSTGKVTYILINVCGQKGYEILIMNETDFMNDVRMKLSQKGFATFRANVGKVRTPDGRWFDVGLPKGFSDVFAIKDGKIYFIETKVRPNKPTKEQLEFIDIMKNRYGCRAGVAYTFEEVEEICQLKN